MQHDGKKPVPDNSKFDSGKRDAVHPKSGVQVAHSCPVLKGPTFSERAGRKPDACPAVSQGGAVPPCVSAKSGRGVGRSPAAVAVACSSQLQREAIDRIIALFRLLDEWERKLNAEKIM
jgi:hypothetical protein